MVDIETHIITSLNSYIFVLFFVFLGFRTNNPPPAWPSKLGCGVSDKYFYVHPLVEAASYRIRVWVTESVSTLLAMTVAHGWLQSVGYR